MNHRITAIICTYAGLAVLGSNSASWGQSFDARELDKLLGTPESLIEGSSHSIPLTSRRIELYQPPTFESLNSLPNFHVVTPGLFRGGQPSFADLQKLKAAGVKTIVDLRNEEVIVREEAVAARKLGLQFVSIPLDVFNPPPEAAVRRFLEVAATPSAQPVYVHCLHGQDRTGTMVAIYRIDKQGWSGDQAYLEMVSSGFRLGFARLTEAVAAHARAAGKPITVASPGDIVADIKKRSSRNKLGN